MAMTAAQLLDELMGKDRNLVPGETSAQVHWSHPDSCKNFLCGFCPSDLFINTKADLGPCGKVHDDQLKLDYEKSSRYGRMGYEEDFVHFLSSIQADVERKIRRGHERLTMNKAREMEMSENDNDKTKMLTDHINQLLEEIESLGSEGKVEEAQGVAKLVEQLKDEREQSKVTSGAAGQEKQMEVCEVCGAFLIVGDAQSRVDDHLQGKQHVGFARIKSSLEELKAKPWQKKKESTDTDKDKDKKDDEKDREKDRDREKRSDRDRDRDRKPRSRSKSRERRRDRSSDKSRDRRRSRDRSDRDRDRSDRDKHRSERDRSDRDRSDRDRDSRRSRDRDSRRSHRSRSPRSRRRSRSKDRDEKKSSRNSSRDRRERRSSRERKEDDEGRRSRRSKSPRERTEDTERDETKEREDTNGKEKTRRDSLENGEREQKEEDRRSPDDKPPAPDNEQIDNEMDY